MQWTGPNRAVRNPVPMSGAARDGSAQSSKTASPASGTRTRRLRAGCRRRADRWGGWRRARAARSGLAPESDRSEVS